MADDGKFYSLTEFKKHYPADAVTRYSAAPRYLDKRLDPADGKYHGAAHFYKEHGKSWSKQAGCIGWDDAKKQKRLDVDGEWRTILGFTKEYGTDDWKEPWETAPAINERRIGLDGKSHDAMWFWEQNEVQRNFFLSRLLSDRLYRSVSFQ